MRKVLILLDIFMSNLLVGTFVICIAYNTFMYYDSQSWYMNLILLFIGVVGSGLGFLISKRPTINRIICGFFSGVSVGLVLSTLGLYRIGRLWFLYSMIFIFGGLFAFFTFRLKNKYNFDVLN